MVRKSLFCLVVAGVLVSCSNVTPDGVSISMFGDDDGVTLRLETFTGECTSAIPLKSDISQTEERLEIRVKGYESQGECDEAEEGSAVLSETLDDGWIRSEPAEKEVLVILNDQENLFSLSRVGDELELSVAPEASADANTFLACPDEGCVADLSQGQ